ncbi:MAG: OmpH family outer membrane protein [Myxococcota bacterium]
MSFKRHVVTLVGGLLMATAVAPQAHAQAKIGVVDLQRAMSETEDGRRAKARLQRLFKQRQQRLNSKQAELKKMKEEIERQKDVLSRNALQQRLESYQEAFVQLQTVYVEYQRELAKKEAELTKSILEKMQQILRRIGQAKGYQLIVEVNEGGVIWAPNHLDLTDEVIQRYNSGGN